MSLTKLKQVRDTVENEGVGVYLDVVQKLFTAIDEHVAEGAKEVDATATTVDSTLMEQAEKLKTRVSELESEVASLKTTHVVAVLDEPVKIEAAPEPEVHADEPEAEHSTETK